MSPNTTRSSGQRRAARSPPEGLAKTPTGIGGIDQITGGGLPRGRPTLVCGTAGCGKTLFAMEFLVRGARQFDEPGVFVAFEETADELRDNVRSLGFDLDHMVRSKQLIVDHVRVERSEIEETGEYNLDGLFIRIAHAIETVKAQRVVLDTIEALFSGFSDDAILRAELRRLFGWLKDRGVTAVITGERGERHLTRRGLEEYVSDCVIMLDQRIHDQVSTQRPPLCRRFRRRRTAALAARRRGRGRGDRLQRPDRRRDRAGEPADRRLAGALRFHPGRR